MQKQKQMGTLAAKVCEILPFDWTIYEIRGQCTKPTEACDFCRPVGDHASGDSTSHFCYKKTTTLRLLYDK